MQNQPERVVLDRDDLRRTLVRIAHEIVEKNPGSEHLALVGIHTRGAVIARRLHALVGELTGSEVPLGDLDISFYRDDLNGREPGAQPIVHSSHLDFDLDGRTVVLVDDVMFTGRTARAAIDALFDYGRPERVQLAVLADRGHRELPIRPDYVGKNLPTARDERVFVRLEEIDELDEVAIEPAAPRDAGGSGAMRHLLSIEDLDRADVERIMARAASFAEVGRRDIKKVPTLRGRTIVSLFYESSTRTSSSFELAAKRLSADVVSVKSSGSSVDKGESLKDTIATLSAYGPEAIMIRHPHAGAAKLVTGWTDAAVINAGDGKHEHPSQALLDTYTLLDRFSALEGRQREDLEGKRIWIVGDVLHSRVARSCALCFRMMGAEVTVCGPPTLIPRGIDRGARGRRRLHARRARRGRRRLRAADAARADDRHLRALDPRVRGQLPDRLAPAGAAAAAHAPGTGQPRGRALARGDRRPRLADHGAGGKRAGGADGGPLRAARRRRRTARSGDRRRRRAARPDPDRRARVTRSPTGRSGAPPLLRRLI